MSGAIDPVNVVINDSVAPSIAINIKAIAAAARDADVSVAALNKQLEAMGANGGKSLSSVVTQTTNLAKAQTAAAAAAKPLAQGVAAVAVETENAATMSARFYTELFVIGREIGRGNYSRMAGSLSILAQQTSLANVLLSAQGLALIGVAGAAALVIFEMGKGQAEMAHFSNALQITHNFAGLTASSLKKMSDELAHETSSSFSTASNVVLKFAQSGKVSGDTLRLLAATSLEYAKRTGEDADKIAADFLKMGDGVVKFAVEHNSQYHDLTASEIDYARQLELNGQTEKAQQVIATAMYQSVRKTGEENIGALVKIWKGLGFAIDDATAALKNFGRSNTIDEQIAIVRRQLADTNHGGKTVAANASIEAGLESQLNYLLKIKAQQDAVAQAGHARDLAEQEGIRASDELNTQKWERFRKGAETAETEIKKLYALDTAALARNPNDTKALYDAHHWDEVTAAIRKSFDPAGAKADKLADSQAAALAKVNKQLDDELKNYTELAPNRLQQEQFDKIENELLAKKIVLKQGDAEWTKINTSLDAIYNAKREQQVKQVEQGAIEQNKYFAIGADERQIQIELDKKQADNIAQGKGPFSDAQLLRMRQALTMQQQLNQLQKIHDAPLENAKGAVDQITMQLRTQNQYTSNLAAMYARIAEMRSKDLLSEQQAAQAKMAVDALVLQERLQGADDFFGQLAGLQSSSNRELAAIGKAAAIAQATIDGIVAVQKALASAPPPWNYAIAAAVGVTTAANVAKIEGIKGFASGGLFRGEGSGTSDSNIVRVSDGEFMVRARQTQKHLGLLQAINDDRVPQNVGSTSPYFGKAANNNQPMNVAVHNYAGVAVSVHQLTPNDVSIMIRQQAPKVIAGDLSVPNSKTSQAVQRNFNGGRKRQ